ncbi:hypothetical protein GH733_006797 [Mirounga leonina]|nr:hypothetical protein GH733_006055 [Mirounga leonina]KAF3826938.1 hypothetical protein GH733_006797 [Mirounga leonina]
MWTQPLSTCLWKDADADSAWGEEPGCCSAGIMSDNEDHTDSDSFEDVEEDGGLGDLENAEEKGQENVESLCSGEQPQTNQKQITTLYVTKYK